MHDKSIFNKIATKFCAFMLIFVLLLSFVACSAEPHNHCYGEWAIVEQATCEDEGLMVRTCECGEVEEYVIPKTDHNYIVDKGYDATCTSTGLTDGAHCSICGEVLIERRVIPKIAHVLETIESESPTFTQSGLTEGKRCSVCGEVIAEQTEIERLKEEDFGYKVTLGSDEHVSVYVYTTQNYNVDPVLSNVAFARDSSSGELLKNGNGQVNFELRFDEGYYLKEILISPSTKYNALKGESDTGRENTFRITKITDELIVFVTSQKQIELADFASITDDDGNVTFSWARDDRIDHISVNVTSDGDNAQYMVNGGANTSWIFEEMASNVQYAFEFTPYSADGIAGDSMSCTRFYNREVKNVSFPRVEITTQNYVFPSCDYVSSPENCVGSGITNNNYEQCVVSLFDADNNSVYSSSLTDDYAQAKVKIRGNTSAYTEKTSYKIKLSKKTDMLSSFLPYRSTDYAHKEWLLLKSGYNINSIVGWCLSETLQMDYTPAYVFCMLYVNGDYRGIYILCESVSQGNGVGEDQTRCAVNDDGFIVECDAYWWNEDLYFTTPLNHYSQRYTFKYPDPDDITASSVEYNYIYNYISEFEAALVCDDESYAEYIDVTTFAKWLVAHDILGNGDPAGSNIYLTKIDSTINSKLRMGPLWDFDGIMNCINQYAYIHNSPIFYYPWLFKKSSFVAEYKAAFNSVKAIAVDYIYDKIGNINSIVYNELIDIENIRWNSHYYHMERSIEEIISKIEQQIAWLDSEILSYGEL